MSRITLFFLLALLPLFCTIEPCEVRPRLCEAGLADFMNKLPTDVADRIAYSGEDIMPKKICRWNFNRPEAHLIPEETKQLLGHGQEVKKFDVSLLLLTQPTRELKAIRACMVRDKIATTHVRQSVNRMRYERRNPSLTERINTFIRAVFSNFQA